MWAANAHVGYLFLSTTCHVRSKKKGKEETVREGGKIQTWDGNSKDNIHSNAPTRAHDQDPVRGLSPLCLIAARMMRLGSELGSLGWYGYRTRRRDEVGELFLHTLNTLRDIPISVTLTVRVTARKASVELK